MDNEYKEIEEVIYREICSGYILMGEINLEICELGYDEDYKDLLKYEESIMGSGI